MTSDITNIFHDYFVSDVFQKFLLLLQIELLNLWGNANVSSCCTNCCQCLPKIRSLVIAACDVKEDFVDELANAVGQLDVPVSLNL